MRLLVFSLFLPIHLFAKNNVYFISERESIIKDSIKNNISQYGNRNNLSLNCLFLIANVLDLGYERINREGDFSAWIDAYYTTRNEFLIVGPTRNSVKLGARYYPWNYYKNDVAFFVSPVLKYEYYANEYYAGHVKLYSGILCAGLNFSPVFEYEGDVLSCISLSLYFGIGGAYADKHWGRQNYVNTKLDYKASYLPTELKKFYKDGIAGITFGFKFGKVSEPNNNKR